MIGTDDLIHCENKFYSSKSKQKNIDQLLVKIKPQNEEILREFKPRQFSNVYRTTSNDYIKGLYEELDTAHINSQLNMRKGIGRTFITLTRPI